MHQFNYLNKFRCYFSKDVPRMTEGDLCRYTCLDWPANLLLFTPIMLISCVLYSSVGKHG